MDNLVKTSLQQGIQRHVVSAVIQTDQGILLLKRPENDFLGGIYELPGGKVKHNESLDVALGREIEEETGTKLQMIETYLGDFDYPNQDGQLTRQFNFKVSIVQPYTIVLQEHDGFVFIKQEDSYNYLITPETRHILEPILLGKI